jgi:hypothetical protein
MFRTSCPGEQDAGGDNQLTPVKKSLGKLKSLKRKKIQCMLHVVFFVLLYIRTSIKDTLEMDKCFA